MKCSKKALLIFSLLLLTCFIGLTRTLPAQAVAQHVANPQQTTRFERISVEDGLSQSAVINILQDHRGFLWFGTEDGLNKYDGYQFTIYKPNRSDPTTLSHNRISALYEDKNGTLWVGTSAGLDRFDRAKDTFTHYRHDPTDYTSLRGREVSAILEDHTGLLWIGTAEGGLNILDRASGTFTHYLHNPNDAASLLDNAVHVIYEDRAGELWIGTDGGLDHFNRPTQTFTHYQHDPLTSNTLTGNAVTAILEDQQGNLWIGTDGGGLNHLDPETRSFTQYQHNPGDPMSLSDNLIWALLEDRQGRLWIGTQNGLAQFDPQQQRFNHFKHDPNNPASLSSDTIWSLYEDRSGVVWIGTYGGGLNKYTRALNNFPLYQHTPNTDNTLSENMVWSLYEDQQGMLWIGTLHEGLNKLDRKTGRYTHYRHDPKNPRSLSSNDVRAILKDHTGRLWIGTGDGLDRFDPRTGIFTHYKHDPRDPHSLSENRVRVLYADRTGTLWVGTAAGGLNKLDPTTGAFIHYQHDPYDSQSLSDNRIRALYEDAKGVLWVGTHNGEINLLDRTTNTFTHYRHDPDDPQSLSNYGIYAFHEGTAVACPEKTSGRVWIATIGGGLNCFNRATGHFTHYTEKNELPNNTVYAILPDDEGNLWLSTNKGLAKFDPCAETFHTYDVRDGLQNNEFNAGAAFRSADGELFFGGIAGFNAFNPEQIKTNNHRPPIIITALEKLNQTVETDLAPDQQIQLSYRDTFIAFEFVALDYTAPEKNLYAYRLEGFDQTWIEAGTRRYKSYTNLEGGTYTFRVKGSNNDGVWNETGTAVHITVTPPFWETWWFQVGIGFALLSVAAIGYRLRVRTIEAQKQALEVQVKERVREIEQRRQAAEGLRDILAVLNSDRPLGEVLDYITGRAGRLLSTHVVIIFRLQPDKKKLEIQAAQGLDQTVQDAVKGTLNQGAIGKSIVEHRPVSIPNTHDAAESTAALQGCCSVLLSIPLIIKDAAYGALVFCYNEPHTFSKEELNLAVTLGDQAALAIENARLRIQIEDSAIAAERNRLARDLHDAVSQTLFSASLIAEVLPRLWERDPEEAARRLKELQQLTRGALAEMRTLLVELRPSALIEAEFKELLRQLSEAFTGKTRIPVTLTIEGACPLSPEIRVPFYRVAQEALNNIAKHAGASKVTIHLTCKPGSTTLHIQDDGCGFDPSTIPPEHFGVSIMRERAEAIEAALTLESQPGKGTALSLIWQETTKEQ